MDSKATYHRFVSTCGSWTSGGVVSGTVVAPKMRSCIRKRCAGACVHLVRFFPSTNGKASTQRRDVQTVRRTHVGLEWDLLQRSLVPCFGYDSFLPSFLHLVLLRTPPSIRPSLRRVCASPWCRKCAFRAPSVRRLHPPSLRRPSRPHPSPRPVIFSREIAIPTSRSFVEVSMERMGSVVVVPLRTIQRQSSTLRVAIFLFAHKRIKEDDGVGRFVEVRRRRRSKRSGRWDPKRRWNTWM